MILKVKNFFYLVRMSTEDEINEEFNNKKLELLETLNARLEKEKQRLKIKTNEYNIVMDVVLNMEKQLLKQKVTELEEEFAKEKIKHDNLETKLIKEYGTDFVVYLKNRELGRNGKEQVPRDNSIKYPEYESSCENIARILDQTYIHTVSQYIQLFQNQYEKDIEDLDAQQNVKIAEMRMFQASETTRRVIPKPSIWDRFFGF
jgi:hypothetical protein